MNATPIGVRAPQPARNTRRLSCRDLIPTGEESMLERFIERLAIIDALFEDGFLRIWPLDGL